MPGYGWSKMLLNILVLDTSLKDKISLEYAWIGLKINIKYTVKLLWQLDSIYTREMHAELFQMSKMSFVKMLNMVLWICFRIGI